MPWREWARDSQDPRSSSTSSLESVEIQTSQDDSYHPLPVLPPPPTPGAPYHEKVAPPQDESQVAFQRFLPGPEPPRLRDIHRSPQNPLLWTPEVIWLLVGIASIIVIVLVLLWADGKPPPQWPLGITLNTFLAFFTSFARTAFMIPVVECIGQLKWTWFNSGRPKRLVDFQLFDEASRSAWGSLNLLIRFKGLLACLAAAITLTGVLTSTVTQQVIHFPVRSAESSNGTASAPIASHISYYNGSTLDLRHGEPLRTTQAISSGAFAVPNQPVAHIDPLCSSGECDWPVYSTLGVCSEVVNLTALNNATLLSDLRNLTSAQLNRTFSTVEAIPDELTHATGGTTTYSGPVFPVVIHILASPTGALKPSLLGLLSSDHFIGFSREPIKNWTNYDVADFQFLEVAFYWCTKTLSTSVRGGIHRTTEISSRAELTKGTEFGLNFAWAPRFYACYLTGTCNETLGDKSAVLGPENYTVNVWTALASSALIVTAMQDTMLLDSLRGIVAKAGGGVAPAYGAGLYGDFLSTSSPPPETQFANVRNISENIATSITNLCRGLVYAGSKTAQNATGRVFTPQTFVQIRWSWMAMLAAQLFLTALLLIATIAETYGSRVQIIKGSAIATLCALDGAPKAELGGIDEVKALVKRSEEVKVKLENAGDGGVALRRYL